MTDRRNAASPARDRIRAGDSATLERGNMIQLPDDEIVLFEECEYTIERGQQAVYDVGAAVKTIRDRRLYRAQYGTFEDYVQGRWGWSRSRAYQMINLSDMAAELSNAVDKGLDLPTRERQVRALRKIPAEERAEVWNEVMATTNGHPTAPAIKAVRERRVPKVYENAAPAWWTDSPERWKRLDAELRTSCGRADAQTIIRMEREWFEFVNRWTIHHADVFRAMVERWIKEEG